MDKIEVRRRAAGLILEYGLNSYAPVEGPTVDYCDDICRLPKHWYREDSMLDQIDTNMNRFIDALAHGEEAASTPPILEMREWFVNLLPLLASGKPGELESYVQETGPPLWDRRT